MSDFEFILKMLNSSTKNFNLKFNLEISKLSLTDSLLINYLNKLLIKFLFLYNNEITNLVEHYFIKYEHSLFRKLKKVFKIILNNDNNFIGKIIAIFSFLGKLIQKIIIKINLESAKIYCIILALEMNKYLLHYCPNWKKNLYHHLLFSNNGTRAADSDHHQQKGAYVTWERNCKSKSFKAVIIADETTD